MNRIIISVVILCVMSVCCFASVGVVNDFTDKLCAKIDEVEKAFEEQDKEKSSKAAEELQNEWSRFLDTAILVNDLGHALEITSSIAEVYSFAQEQNEELYAACDRAQAQIEMFRDMQTPTLWKIL
ncbi:MAG: DUF4363 family protein [Lachnospiraceae bacterium]|nr:DUF4363 family protein [Ruminococcus sp.]MCM1274210.1 DUF4363 family protein [Lachnospiraceae bacterium]